MRSSVLGVGTELTDGQIINRNAAWLSERLKGLGARTALHLTVPDDRAAIREGLELCASHSDLIFVTGGLGPTSDDFTRDLISEWSGLPLEWHEPSWQHIVKRLTERHYPVQEIQRQQCYFPAGSVVLMNSQGTANGFRLEAKGKHLVVLPGPPREIEAIWKEELLDWINQICGNLDPLVTCSWDVVGLGESQVAQITEPIAAPSGLELGYRVHLPYVEFKITHRRSQTAMAAPFVEAITQALQEWTLARDGDDVATALAGKLTVLGSLDLVDEVTGSFLIQRLVTPLRHLWATRSWNLRSRGENQNADVQLWIRPAGEFSVKVGLHTKDHTVEKEIEAPMRSPLMSERRQQYFAEMALAFWLRES